jgi:hypothetical protein
MRILSSEPGQRNLPDSEYQNKDSGESSWNEKTNSNRKLSREQLISKIISVANSKVSLAYIFEKYNIEFEIRYSPNGWTHVCPCPFPDHNDVSPSFGYNPEEGRFNCFGCHRSGRAVQFVAFMENEPIIDVAKKLLKSSVGDGENIIKAKQFDYKKLEVLLFEFADCVREFRINHIGNKVASAYADNVTWGIDLYLDKNAPSQDINVDQIEVMIGKLKDKLELYEEEE